MSLAVINLYTVPPYNSGNTGIPANTNIPSQWIDITDYVKVIGVIAGADAPGTLYLEQSNDQATVINTNSVDYTSTEQITANAVANYARVRAVTGSSVTNAGLLTLDGVAASFQNMGNADATSLTASLLTMTGPVVGFEDKGGQVFNVKAYGAKGDGVTDDTAAIQAVVNEAAAISGIVFFPPGTYICNNVQSPTQTTGELILQGCGMYATTLLATKAVNAVIAVQMCGEVRDMSVDAGGIATNALNMSTNVAVDHLNARRVRCRNVASNGRWVLIVWDLTQTWLVDTSILEDVVIEGPTNISSDAMAVAFTKTCFVNNMSIRNVGRTPNFFAIQKLKVDGLDIIDTLGSGGVVFDSLVENIEVSNMTTDSSSTTIVKAAKAHFTNSDFNSAVNLGDGSFNMPIDITFDGCTILGNKLSTTNYNSIQINTTQANLSINGGRMGYGGAAAIFLNLGAVAAGKISLSNVEIDQLPQGYLFTSNTGNTPLGQVQISNCAGLSPGRQVVDAVTNSTTTLTSATANFVSTDVGRSVYGSGIPVGTTISSVTNATTIVMSLPATASATAVNVGFGFLNVPLVLGSYILPSATTKISNTIGFNPSGPQTAPTMPASGTALTNPFPFDCTVYVSGGTVTEIAVGGTATGLTSGAIFIPAGETITLTYSATPTWVWIGN